MKGILRFFLIYILIVLGGSAKGEFRTRFLEFWRYVTNSDEHLSRHKRISVDDKYGGLSLEPDSFKPESYQANQISERSAESKDEIRGQSHTIRTVSSVEVPTEDQGSGREDTEEASGLSRDMSKEKHPRIEIGPSDADLEWPQGQYGLPQPVTNCPVKWKTGYRYHDTEDDGTENQHSDILHLVSNFTDDGIMHGFCIKDSETGKRGWPEGKYCIYKRGPHCPAKMKEGFVIWDDENTDNQNDANGALPEGMYTDDTKIYFCCSTNGNVDNAISLPTKTPFYLFAYQSIKCQKVHNMKSTSEFIKFDDEDHGNIDYEGGEYPYGIHKAQKDHMLFLCYYEPDPHAALSKSSKGKSAKKSQAETKESDEKDEEEKALERSEEMMKAFLTATGGEEEETNKSERTRTIIKTIKVPVKAKSQPIAIIVGLVLGGVVISTAIIIIVKYMFFNQTSSSKAERVETTWVADPATENEKKDEIESDDEISLIESDFEEEEDELVEDQLLPDSELKSGLELMFLKQQRHYWSQSKKSDKHM